MLHSDFAWLKIFVILFWQKSHLNWLSSLKDEDLNRHHLHFYLICYAKTLCPSLRELCERGVPYLVQLKFIWEKSVETKKKVCSNFNNWATTSYVKMLQMIFLNTLFVTLSYRNYSTGKHC